jgi:hypothetical protein
LQKVVWKNEGHIIVTDSTAKPGPDSLIAAARAAEKTGKLPPVHLWDPPFCGDLDMEIRRDGTWFYEGTPIGRKPLVRLFSTILKLEDGQVLPRHAGRKGRHPGGGRALRGGGFRGRGRRPRRR